MMVRKLCVAAALIAAAGCLTRATFAAEEIVVVRKQFGFDSAGNFGVLSETEMGRFDAGAPITVNVGIVDPQTYTVLHIFDVTTLTGAAPVHSAGNISITADFEGQFYTRNFAVFIAAAGDVFSPSAQVEFAEGVVDLGSVSVTSAEPAGDVDAIAATKFAASITGDVVGNISVGEVFRVAARARFDGAGTYLGGGRLLGTIAATRDLGNAASVGGGIDIHAIRYLSFGKSIAGSVRAEYSGVGLVFVGTAASPGEITGSILAPNGSIGAVLCAGPIGTTSTPATISAGDSIRQIRTVAYDAAGQLLPYSVNANITAGTLFATGTPSGYAGLLTRSGAIGLIEAGGKLAGAVSGLYLGLGAGAVDGNLPTRGVDGRTGISVRGRITAPIDIAWNLAIGDIIGSSIDAPISIGNQAKGSIVAYGQGADSDGPLGHLSGVKIGLASDRQVPAVVRQQYPPGFVGTDAPPLDRGKFRNETPPVGRTLEEIWFRLDTPQDNGAKDSVIFASTIGSLNVRRMSQLYTGFYPSKFYRPRIEAGYIDELVIGDMAGGVVWSGLLEYGTDAQGAPVFGPNGQLVSNDQTNDYASIGTAVIGCMSPTSDIYVNGNFGSFRVDGDVLGEVHLPSIESGRTVSIGGKLGAAFDSTTNPTGDFSCVPPAVDPLVPINGAWPSYDSDELSPRGHDRRVLFDSERFTLGVEPDFAPTGAIRIAEPAGLHGQITVNAAGAATVVQEPAKYLKGLVWLGDGVTVPEPRIMGRTLYTDASLALPLYSAQPAALGGGAVGLVPFALHGAACEPQQASAPGTRFTYGALRSGLPVRLVHYGPVQSNAALPVGIERRNFDSSVWTPAQDDFTASVSGRTVTLTATSVLGFGAFRVTSSPVLRSVAVNTPAVSPYLGEDGVHFYTNCGSSGYVNPADIDGDNQVDGTDFILFINSFSIGDAAVDPAADVAGGTDPYFEAGGPDGVIDGSDFIAFINAFAIGC